MKLLLALLRYCTWCVGLGEEPAMVGPWTGGIHRVFLCDSISLSGSMVAKRVAVPGSILSLSYWLCGVSVHMLSVSMWFLWVLQFPSIFQEYGIRQIGQSELPLGVNKCMNVCVHGVLKWTCPSLPGNTHGIFPPCTQCSQDWLWIHQYKVLTK